MYYPYFRGKQYDLIAIRENADLLAKSNFVPIIEPVKEVLNGLNKVIEAVLAANGEMVLIVNPQNGDHVYDPSSIQSLLSEGLKNESRVLAGVLLTEGADLNEIKVLLQSIGNRKPVFIHAGFADGKQLGEYLASNAVECRHVFFEDYCGKLYRKHFSGPRSTRILMRDGFKKRANRLHPPVEVFSDLHVTYLEEGMNGFGDFLIVGDEYSETGGPAYAVAIHLTFIDPNKDNEMYIHHFKSIRNDTPTDPAGKFAEALSVLVAEVNDKDTLLFKSTAIAEFLDLHKRGHFPGLGYVKKLSMQHHIETLANFLQNN